ncbi:glycosyltransferase [Macrococcus carouselicus]|uniref:Glucosyl-3-phosphoglycerate synthase n=1 Tax=Macrococcus carouselicus TaxID=69969 RepID=A0A9Q8FQ13_9STAP|nr:glycosyltransferase [Macrococcus carouselicus]TDL95497.1 glycosyltransferase [Macrococcus carouselicus]
MFVIGIPSYNESKNIKALVEKIDTYSSNLGEKIIIVNSDNNSPDGTSKVFKNTPTVHKKISIITKEIGKGYNIRAIFEEVVKIKGCLGCILIDGDITSLDEEWLKKNFTALKDGADYVIPNYKRSFQEGNTTNHFIFPLIQYQIPNCPMQLIAGDFALSKKYVQYLINEIVWHKYAYTYGVDIFLSLHALYGDFNVTEIELDRKVHNPSFHKIEKMFYEVASSYYETKKILTHLPKSKVIKSNKDYSLIDPIYKIDINIIKNQKNNAINMLNTSLYNDDYIMSDKEWSKILFDNENIKGQSSSQLAKNILPFFLLRVTSYLQSCTNKSVALKSIFNVSHELRNMYR